jgi:hypothetical protein
VFEAYLERLGSGDAATVGSFLAELDQRCLLPRSQKDEMRRDFERALVWYDHAGVALTEALTRLAMTNLGGFYARPSQAWYRLDDAAKIYPLSMRHGRMEVFRLAARLTSPVVPELLQMALTFTVKRFPTFATSVKKGMFWHYLDAAKRRHVISPETDLPCQPLKIAGSSAPPFRVAWYRDRISVEYFHVLTDGAGGMVFLKTLVAEYLRLLTGADPASTPDDGILDVNAAASAQEAANEFPRAEKTELTSGFIDKRATQMGGHLSRIKPCRVLHFRIDAEQLRAVARRRNATVTAYLLACMFVAGRAATDELTGEHSIQVPVDMRKFYPSRTLRNFSMYCGVRLGLDQIGDLDTVLPAISDQLTRKASKSAMSQMLNSTLRIVTTTRWVPLFIKAPVARLIYGFLGDSIFSNTLSNLGVVTFPEPLASQVAVLDFVLGAPQTNRASCALVTYGGTATLSITKVTLDPSFEETVHALLTADGIDVTVEGTAPHEG